MAGRRVGWILSLVVVGHVIGHGGVRGRLRVRLWKGHRSPTAQRARPCEAVLPLRRAPLKRELRLRTPTDEA
jgi:hypothetical protein